MLHVLMYFSSNDTANRHSFYKSQPHEEGRQHVTTWLSYCKHLFKDRSVTMMAINKVRELKARKSGPLPFYPNYYHNSKSGGYIARTKNSIMHYPRLTWTILLWLSSYLFHHVSPVLQQAGMKLFYLEENNLDECTHCLLYGIGATRLTPTSLIPAEDARDSNVVEYKAIGSQFFFASASNFCQGRNMCINVETHNIHNIDEKGADLSSMPEKVSEITKKKRCA